MKLSTVSTGVLVSYILRAPFLYADLLPQNNIALVLPVLRLRLTALNYLGKVSSPVWKVAEIEVRSLFLTRRAVSSAYINGVIPAQWLGISLV